MINTQRRWSLAVIWDSMISLLRNRSLLDHACYCRRYHDASKSG
jgi:hypothetical protein